MEEKEKKVVVDQDKCFRCGFCVGNFPESFKFGEEGAAEAVDGKVTPDVQAAVDSCPAGAIKIVEE